MKTIEISREEIEARVARYQGLGRMKNQDEAGFPQDALDVAFARELLPVIGLEDQSQTALTDADATPISGAGGMTMTMVKCPPGQGPGLHSHLSTYETFTVLQGRFEFSWGDHGEDSMTLDRFDVVSFPPGFCRAFRNVGDEEGIMQVLITGGTHDMNDIDFRPEVAQALKEKSPDLLTTLEQRGMTFTAGQE
jgi:quercetin dioxygenase-like cupin family protein